MPVETAADRAIFFDPRDFGDEALYSPRDGSAPYAVPGLFDEPTNEFNPNQWPGHPYQLNEGAHFVVSAPTFTCRTRDLKGGGKARDGITVGGRAWVVSKAKPDGTDVTVLHLTEADGEESSS